MRFHSKVPGRHEFWKGYFSTHYNSQIKVNHQNQNLGKVEENDKLWHHRNVKKFKSYDLQWIQDYKIWVGNDVVFTILSTHGKLKFWKISKVSTKIALEQNITLIQTHSLRFGIRYRWTFTYIIRSGIATRLKAGEEIFQLKGLSFNYWGWDMNMSFRRPRFPLKSYLRFLTAPLPSKLSFYHDDICLHRSMTY